MPNSLPHRCARLLLAAAILATTSTTPEVTHAHIGGAKPHTHSADSHESRDLHAARVHHHHHEHDADDDHLECSHDHAVVDDGIAHTHTTFFGFPLTVPAKDSKSTAGDDAPSAVQAEVAAVPVDFQPTTFSTLNLSTQLALPTAALGLAEDNLSYAYHPPHSQRSLLCDTARRERSGVLLA